MAKKQVPDWKNFSEEAPNVTPAPDPVPASEPWRAPAPEEPPPLPATRPGQKETFSTYVPVGTRLALRELALKLTRERGSAVSVTDLASEAFDDLFRKYERK